MTAPEGLQITGDLTGEELIAIHGLAALGTAVMGGNAELVVDTLEHLAICGVSPSEAKSALKKLEVMILLAAKELQEREARHAV